MSYNFTYCPICGRPVVDNWCIQHMKLIHPATDNLTDTETKAIAKSSRDGYYGWETFQWEQHEEF